MSEPPSIPILLPDLGAGDQPVRLAQWLVDGGETVLAQDRIAEVLIGGVLFHVASPAEGTLHRLIEREGAPLPPGATLGFVVNPAPAPPKTQRDS